MSNEDHNRRWFRCNRRWYQRRFSLRTLLNVMTFFVVGVACVKIVYDLLGMFVPIPWVIR